MELEAVYTHSQRHLHGKDATRTHSHGKDVTRTPSYGKDATRKHIRMAMMRLAHTFAEQRYDLHRHSQNKDTTRTHIRRTKIRLALTVSCHSQFQTRSLIFSLFLEMNTCSVKVVVVSTRVDEQLLLILRNSEERRKCLEPSNVMDQIVVCLL